MASFNQRQIDELAALHLTGVVNGKTIKAGVKIDDYYSLTVNADAGYFIQRVSARQDDPRPDYPDIINAKVANDKKSANFAYAYVSNLDFASNPTFTGEITDTFDVVDNNVYFTQKIVDEFAAQPVTVTVDGEPLTLESVITDDMTLVVTVDSGYDFNSFGYYTRGGVYHDISIVDGVATANDFDGFTASTNTNFYFDVEQIPVEPPKVYFNQKIVDEFAAQPVTVTVDGEPLTTDSVITDDMVVVVTANNGYEINAIAYYTYGGVSRTFTISDDKLTATSDYFTGFTASTNTNFYFDVEQIPVEPPKVYFNQKIVDEFAAQPVTVTVDGEPLTTDSVITDDMVVVVTANNGYEINEIFYRIRGGAGKYFIIDLDLQTARSSDWYGFEPQDNADNFFFIVDVVTPDVLNVNDVYLTDSDTARAVTKLSFTVDNGLYVSDYSYALLGLIELPFLLNDTDLFAEQNIRLGTYDTGLSALLLNFDKYNYSMGSITVPNDKDNALDFANTVCMLHLPYAKSIVIDNEFVIGQTVYVDYLVNMYDGTAIINIKSTKTDAVVYSTNIDLNISIPFANTRTAPTQNRPYDIELGGFNGLFVPYIDVMRNDAILENGFFTIPVTDESLLLNQVGFIKVDEIELKTKATANEKQMILDALTNGVIIK